MPRNELICTMLSAVCLACSCSTNRPVPVGSAEQLRADAQAQAKSEGKQVFLLFTHPTASWSQVFEAYHADPAVSRVLQRHFVLTRIDAGQTPGGEQMYLEYGGTNTFPSFAILDAHGMMLANSGDGAQNIGFPTSPEEVDRYFAALKTACPKLDDEEIDVLRAKLKELRPNEGSEPGNVKKPAPSAAAPECRTSPQTAGRFA